MGKQFGKAESLRPKAWWLPTVDLALWCVATPLAVVGFIHGWEEEKWWLIVLSIIVPAVPLVLLIYHLTRQFTDLLIAARPQTQDQTRMLEVLESINDRMMVSDAAKRIAYRERDRQTLRRAIQEDISRGDLEAALALATEMAQSYGYKQEGEEFRRQILEARRANYDRQVLDAIGQLEQMLARKEWESAALEAKRIQATYTESTRVTHLLNRVAEAKEQHKKDLERQFLEAAKRDDIETAMELLKDLDHYLTEKEAAPLLEVARGVIGKKRQNLGVQFKLAIADHEWSDALAVGNQIIREFPNTKMADEVHSMIDLLRERAAAQQEAGRSRSGY